MTIAAACGSGSTPDRGAGPTAREQPEAAPQPEAAARTEVAPAERHEQTEADSSPPLDYSAAVIVAPEGGREVEVRVALARTEPQRARGLMHRRQLPPDAGMLFLFDRMEHQSFWMENTLIPLDMIFIDDDLRVVGVVHAAEPLTRDAREVEGESQYVLEVNAGFAARHDITAGVPVRFENVPGVPVAGDDDEETQDE